MRKIHCTACLLLCFALLSCTSSTPSPTQIISPTRTTLPTIQVIAPTSTTVPPTQIVAPTAAISPTRVIIPTLPQMPIPTTIPLSPNAITADNAAALIEVGTLHNNSNMVTDLSFSPVGKILASGYSRNWVMERPVDIILWNLETMTENSRISGSLGSVNSIDFNPNGAQLASGSSDGTARLWNIVTGESTLILEGYPITEGETEIGGTELKMYPVTNVAFSPDGAILAVGGGGFMGPGWLELYETATGKKLSMLYPTECSFPCEGSFFVNDIVFSPNGTLLASSSGGGDIVLWNVAKSIEIRRLAEEGYSLGHPDFSPNGKTLAFDESWTVDNSGLLESFDRGVHFWDVETGEMLDSADVGDKHARAIIFSPDGKLLAIGQSKNVVIWDIATRQIVAQVSCGNNPVIRFSPDGSILAIGDESGTIHLWGVPGD